MKDRIKLGIIGVGNRGYGLLELALYRMKDVDIVAVCDLYEDRVTRAKTLASRFLKSQPNGYIDYKDLVAKEQLDAVIVSCSWAKHTEIAVYCLEHSIPVASEVGGAYTIDECWTLVNCQERTGTPFMVLENCCYGETELAVLNMVRQGLFGTVVSLEGGYKHDLRDEITYGYKNRHYRLEEYKNRNCENYPTHEIGPIARVIDLNYGNRMVSLTSTSSKAVGLKEYVSDNMSTHKELLELKDVEWKQGDIVNTIIKCHNGETISLMLDTTLPRPYSRSFTVHGTKAFYTEDGNYFFLQNNARHRTMHFQLNKLFNNGKRIIKKYRHPIWNWFKKNGVKGGHGGMDWLVLRAFVEAVKKGDGKMPIDVYDAASWMVITALSTESIKNNSAPVEFPDFTKGAWKTRKPEGEGIYFLK